LFICDDGKGFDPKASPRASGLGLVGMWECARLNEGEFFVDAQPDHGTRLKLVLRLLERNS
jgi:signal transduction histidine kinase